MNGSVPISIVVVSDDHYVILLAALIKSIEVNHKTKEPLEFYVVEDNVKEKTKKKLEASVNPAITTLHWINMADAVPSGIELPLDKSSWPLNIYMRLFISYFLPKKVEKVIYLDVDMIVQKDISLLWNLDIKDKIIAAVTDSRIKTIDCRWGGVANYKELNLEGSAKYFNTGLLMVDIKKWKAANITSKVLECIKVNKDFANFPDQYGLNVLLADHWQELDGLWNYFAEGDHADPNIIHFMSTKPIYKSYNYNQSYQDLFFHYLSQTPWNGESQISSSRIYYAKARNKVRKIMKKIFGKNILIVPGY
ncbi:glycosyltransferase family 8 protein [Rufibacter latericius]|uniref:Glycosyltransferase family 8 protein n=1 Tax=Rufibacter latericius TaxID=2487040 RepID=A0A3M9MJC3_9BACT|nr:glycosyltransferase family 8 protein [Rufibacter latericius]RNI25604.1 glycosyltransferase family 8 protein [Rufibacter latericius]